MPDSSTITKPKILSFGDMLADDPLAEWKAFYSLMVSAVPGLQGSDQYAFQFTNPERGADWWKEGQEKDLDQLIDDKPASSGAFYGPGVSTISQNYELFLLAIESEDPSLKKAIERYDKALDEDNLTMSLDGNLESDLESWRRGEGNILDITITKDTKVDHQWHLVAGGDVEVLGFNISGQGEVLDRKLVDEKYKLQIRYEAIRAYHMSRGRNWWNGGLINVYNSDATNFIPPYTRSSFFNPQDGLLNMIPATVIVGYRYRLNLTISKTNYEEFRLDIEGKGGISIGPFKLNANVKYTQTDIDESKEEVTISYESISQDPVNFGVFSVMNLNS